MKKIIFAIILLSQTSWAGTTTLPSKAFAPTQKRVVANATNWAGIKADLKTLEARFKDPRLTEDQKVDLLPVTNQLLSIMQEINLNTHERTDAIATVVELMAASVEYDFASSNQDTLFFHYLKYKKEYLEQLNKLPQETRIMIKEIFMDFETSANGY